MADTPTTISCSRLPRLLRCPASAQSSEIAIGSSSEAARLGSALHTLLAAVVEGRGFDVQAVATRYEVDVDAIMPLFHIGRNIWREYDDSLKVLAVEAGLQSAINGDTWLRGKADVIALTLDDEPSLVVLDWKSGSPDADHRAQLMGYAWLAWLSDWGGAAGSHIKIITVWLRDQIVEIEDIDAAALDEWHGQLDYALAHPDNYGPSAEACKFCPRQHECPARTALVRRSVEIFLDTGDSVSTDLAPAQLAALYPKAKLLEKVLEHFHAALRATLDEHGTLSTGDGRELALQTTDRESIDPVGMWPALYDIFGTADSEEIAVKIRAAMNVAKGKLCSIVGATAKPRMKGKLIKEFMDRLRADGAITKTPVTSLVVRKAEKEETDGRENRT